MEGEPWNFDKNILVLRIIREGSRPSELAETGRDPNPFPFLGQNI